jgi:transcriptional regulator with XRE-family HTH domain
MDLPTRIKEIIGENHLKQKEFAQNINVTESYVSKLLRGDSGLSKSTAMLIEVRYGYSTEWVLNGTYPKMRESPHSKSASPAYKKILADLEHMDEQELAAVVAFITSLKNVRESLIKQPPSQSDV